MPYKLVLNGEPILEGDFKTLRQTFNSLSGLAFAKTQQSNWLNKMTARESYSQYLHIMSRELKVDKWEGLLQLVDNTDAPEAAHLFSEGMVNQPTPSASPGKPKLSPMACPVNGRKGVQPSMVSSVSVGSRAAKG